MEAEQDLTKRNEVIDRKTAHQKLFEKLWKDIAVPNPAVSAPCNWISLDWLKSWIKGECEVQEKPIDNTSLACRHEKLDPRKLASAKRIKPVRNIVICIYIVFSVSKHSVGCVGRIVREVQRRSSSDARILLQAMHCRYVKR